MRRFLKKICLLFSVLCIVVLATACSSSTYTQYPSDYKFYIGETAEIIDSFMEEKIGEITIVSCELVSDETFFVQEENEEREFTALYKITYTGTGSCSYATDENFVSEDFCFEINPDSRRSEGKSFYLGAEIGNKGKKSVTIGYYHNSYQEEPTALFEIVLDEVVPYKIDYNKRLLQNVAQKVDGVLLNAMFLLIFTFYISLFVVGAELLGIGSIALIDRLFGNKTRKIRELKETEKKMEEILKKAGAEKSTVPEEKD